jgi:hypothetical protein
VNTNYGPSDFQATHVLNAGWILNFPMITAGGKAERVILNNWSFGGIFNARTGNPFDVAYAGDVSGTDERPQRPALLPGFTIKDAVLPSGRHRTAKVAEWFNPSVFNITPGLGYTNPISRNALYGPAFLETDFSLRRTITLPYNGVRFEMRGDAFNVFNTPNLANPYARLSGNASTAANEQPGVILATVGKNGFAGTNGRRIQIALIIHY